MGKTTITNVTVFDGDDILPNGPHTVIISDHDGTISSISPTTTASPPADTNDDIVDGTNHTLLPGLIDSHVHIGAASHLHDCSLHGVTTAVDLGAYPLSLFPAMKKAVSASNGNQQQPILADYLGSGLAAFPPTTMHCHFYHGVNDDNDDGLLPNGGSAAVEPDTDISAWVQERVEGKAGEADVIKIIADAPGFSQEQIDELVKQSRKRGKITVAHGTTLEAYRRAIQGDVDVLTHVPIDGVLEDEEVERLRRDGRKVISPTLTMMGMMITSEHFGGKMEGKPEVRYCYENVRKLYEAGVKVVVGTDANRFAMPIGHGDGLHGEMGLMVKECGMSDLDVLRGATGGIADVYKLADRGRVKEGLRADLLLVEGDPTVDVGVALKGKKKVWVRGREVS